MAKQSPLEMLIDIQEDKVDEALTSVGAAQQALTQAKDQLEMLVQYRAEYEQRFRDQTKTGLQPVHLDNYQAFMSKLNYAVEHQQIVIVQLERRLEESQQHWIEEKNQFNAYSKLKDRQDKLKQAKENKIEQKMSDEYGAKKYTEKQNNR